MLCLSIFLNSKLLQNFVGLCTSYVNELMYPTVCLDANLRKMSCRGVAAFAF